MRRLTPTQIQRVRSFEQLFDRCANDILAHFDSLVRECGEDLFNVLDPDIRTRTYHLRYEYQLKDQEARRALSKLKQGRWQLDQNTLEHTFWPESWVSRIFLKNLLAIATKTNASWADTVREIRRQESLRKTSRRRGGIRNCTVPRDVECALDIITKQEQEATREQQYPAGRKRRYSAANTEFESGQQIPRTNHNDSDSVEAGRGGTGNGQEDLSRDDDLFATDEGMFDSLFTGSGILGGDVDSVNSGSGFGSPTLNIGFSNTSSHMLRSAQKSNSPTPSHASLLALTTNVLSFRAHLAQAQIAYQSAAEILQAKESASIIAHDAILILSLNLNANTHDGSPAGICDAETRRLRSQADDARMLAEVLRGAYKQALEMSTLFVGLTPFDEAVYEQELVQLEQQIVGVQRLSDALQNAEHEKKSAQVDTAAKCKELDWLQREWMKLKALFNEDNE